MRVSVFVAVNIQKARQSTNSLLLASSRVALMARAASQAVMEEVRKLPRERNPSLMPHQARCRDRHARSASRK